MTHRDQLGRLRGPRIVAVTPPHFGTISAAIVGDRKFSTCLLSGSPVTAPV